MYKKFQDVQTDPSAFCPVDKKKRNLEILCNGNERRPNYYHHLLSRKTLKTHNKRPHQNPRTNTSYRPKPSDNVLLKRKTQKKSEDGKFLAKRLSVLLSYATGVIAADSSVFVDFDTLPESGASLGQTLKFLLAEEARPLRAALVGEVRVYYFMESEASFYFMTAPTQSGIFSALVCEPKLRFLVRPLESSKNEQTEER